MNALVTRLNKLHRAASGLLLGHACAVAASTFTATTYAWRPSSPVDVAAALAHTALTCWLGYGLVRVYDLRRDIHATAQRAAESEGSYVHRRSKPRPSCGVR